MTDTPDTKVVSAYLSSGGYITPHVEVKIEDTAVAALPRGEADPTDIPRRFLVALADWSLRGLGTFDFTVPQWGVEFTEPRDGDRMTYAFDTEEEARDFMASDDTSGNSGHVLKPPTAVRVVSVAEVARALDVMREIHGSEEAYDAAAIAVLDEVAQRLGIRPL